MTILGLATIHAAMRKHRDAAHWIERWIEITAAAAWTSLTDVRRDFPSADGVKVGSGAVVTVFNVRGNVYRLLTVIAYKSQTVQVIALLTHAEYDKQKWK